MAGDFAVRALSRLRSVTADREEADVHTKSGFAITPADFSAAAKRIGMAADALAALAERVLIEAEEYGSRRADNSASHAAHAAHAPAHDTHAGHDAHTAHSAHAAHADSQDEHAYADGVGRAAALVTECVRRLREMESNAHNVADAYQKTEDAAAGRFR